MAPPAPPLLNNADASTPMNRHQKMMRQKQLQLKRQRDLRQRTHGIVVVQSDPPEMAAMELQKKAAVWDKFLSDLERPQKRKGKSADPSPSPDCAAAGDPASAAPETAVSTDCPAATDVPLPAVEKVASVESTRADTPTGVIDLQADLKIGDVDSDCGTVSCPMGPLRAGKLEERPAARPGGGEGPQCDRGGPRPARQCQGWDLQVQGDDSQSTKADKASDEASGRGRNMWRPWQRASRRAQVAEPGEMDHVEPTRVASFNEGSSGRGSPIDLRAVTPWQACSESEECTQLDEVMPMPLPGSLCDFSPE